jgi:hypothetical protein
MWWPASLACVLILAMVVGAAAASETGMRIGGYLPFSFANFATSLEQLLAFTLGPSLPPAWLGAAGAALAAILVLRPELVGRRRFLYALAILGLPLAVALLRPGNSQYARYYLVGAVALLLLASELIARALAQSGWSRWAAAAALAAILAAGLWRDAALLATKRGDPGGPVREMARLAPRGAGIRVESERLVAVVRVAALRARYPLRIVVGCAGADFVLVSSDFAAPVDPALVRCGRRLDAIASSRVVGISGDAWTLYAVQALQRSRAPVSGPPPAR